MATGKGRPTLPVGERKIPLDVMMKPKTVDEIDQAAARVGVSRSRLIEFLCEEGVKSGMAEKLAA